jgi:hypothetical protein
MSLGMHHQLPCLVAYGPHYSRLTDGVRLFKLQQFEHAGGDKDVQRLTDG